MERKSGMNLSNNYAVDFDADGNYGVVWRVDNLQLYCAFEGITEVDGEFYVDGVKMARRLTEEFRLDYSRFIHSYDGLAFTRNNYPNHQRFTYVLTGPGVEHHFNDERKCFGDREDLYVWLKCPVKENQVEVDYIRIPGNNSLRQKMQEETDAEIEDEREVYFQVWFRLPKDCELGSFYGTIYPHGDFISSLCEQLIPYLGEEVAKSINYTEYGMQGHNYVSVSSTHPKFRERFKLAQCRERFKLKMNGFKPYF